MSSKSSVSVAFSSGIKTCAIFCSRAIMIIEMIPLTGRTVPWSESSPIKRLFVNKSGFINPDDASMPIAMGRSNADPSLGISAGARLTVIRESGIVKFVLTIAVRTLSFASSIDLSGRPTMANVGNPRSATSTSTLINIPSSPTTHPEYAVESIRKNSKF